MLGASPSTNSQGMGHSFGGSPGNIGSTSFSPGQSLNDPLAQSRPQYQPRPLFSCSMTSLHRVVSEARGYLGVWMQFFPMKHIQSHDFRAHGRRKPMAIRLEPEACAEL